MQQAVTQAIAGLSERKVQFTYTDVLARTVGILPPENGVIERARAGIDEAISREQLIPLDREKGLFTSGIHVLDELSVRALSRDIMKQNRVTVHPEKSVPRTAGYSDAVSVLAQDRPSLAIVSSAGCFPLARSYTAFTAFGVAACVSDVLLVALLSCTVPFTVSEAAGTSVIWLHGCV